MKSSQRSFVDSVSRRALVGRNANHGVVVVIVVLVFDIVVIVVVNFHVLVVIVAILDLGIVPAIMLLSFKHVAPTDFASVLVVVFVAVPVGTGFVDIYLLKSFL